MQEKNFKKVLLVLFLCFLSITTFAQKFSPTSYVEEHKQIAQRLSREQGVPASVILAIAMHESANGNSKVAKNLNNHFGIKGKNNSKTIRSSYKGYSSILDSYHDFVALLKRRTSTQKLFDKYDSDDYLQWINGIARSGYSHSKSWKSQVLGMIKRYGLDELDTPVSENKSRIANRLDADVSQGTSSKLR
ncbi:glucosaminidase domain-containing protein [Sphingobacterium spiritivorum]|uniref:Mannosyl-glycoprotein endo-beta-N-acetylglucosaminidase n=1 Tax=Sphingobacterium spiritivorum ATCC 33861 TaxID=525373 RepID=D7VIZ1_SPHSI|nr:glucosaminidase domain-containing protein [Sphingobacterium spiritivorum]EFK60043.1 mannosyl-glycoprotein endo-beta-N-acetylglucosaminidase [Sphingobacterium spiritivorum ATCC 33861]QQT37333.1 glucosaminidase domain-containing protein [Sphingobacterium spiritivorum]WQD34121.1 glucosaminidase domain-containing protein [Sphingobacterium spiritivorum]SUJ29798.1 Exo-glucosaminidase lytG precursor [Sphingobacterium spiritivorum]